MLWSFLQTITSFFVHRDLKRDVAKKLQVLERRTQKAIAELIRDRMQEAQEDISQAVNIGTALHSKAINEDDDD